MDKHCENKKIEWTKFIVIVSPLAVIAGSIYAYGSLDTTVKSNTKRIDRLDQAIIEIKEEFSESKNEMTKTQGQVAVVQQKVELTEKNLMKQMDKLEQNIENSFKELRVENHKLLEVLVENIAINPPKKNK